MGEALTVTLGPDATRTNTIAVDELVLVSQEQVVDWRIHYPLKSPRELDGSDVYLVRYSVIDADDSGIRPHEYRASTWALANDEGEEFRGGLVSTVDPAAGCPPLGNAETRGCAVIVVPAGETITMVRYWGVDDGYIRGSTIGDEDWAGWSVP